MPSSGLSSSSLPVELALKLLTYHTRQSQMASSGALSPSKNTGADAERRLRAVLGHIQPGGLIVVLRDGSKVTASLVADLPSAAGPAPSPSSSLPSGIPMKLFHANRHLATFLVSNEDSEKVAWDVVADGTRYEDNAAHLGRWPIVRLTEFWPAERGMEERDVWMVIYAFFSLWPDNEYVPLKLALPEQDNEQTKKIERYLIETGLGAFRPGKKEGRRVVEGVVFVSRAAFWQGAGTHGYHSLGWAYESRRGASPFPRIQSYTRNDKVITSHPLRPPRPVAGEVLYARWCREVQQMFTIEFFDMERHMEAFHRWHNDDRVNAAWGERGSMESHREYVLGVLASGHSWPVMMKWDGELMGYAEIVWTKEDVIGHHYAAGDWDRAIHVLAGESRFLGGGRSVLWIRGLQHFIFLDDARTERVMGEPNVRNGAILSVAAKSGFSVQRFVDFPHKRSALLCISRDRFLNMAL